MSKYTFLSLTVFALGLFLLGGQMACVTGNQGGSNEEIQVDYQNSAGQGQEAGGKVFISGSDAENNTIEAGFASHPGAVIENTEGTDAEVADAPTYVIANNLMNMKVEYIATPLETKQGELRNLQQNRENLTTQMLAYAGTTRGEELGNEARALDQKIEAVRQEIIDLENNLSVTQLNNLIEKLEQRKIEISGSLKILGDENRNAVDRRHEGGGGVRSAADIETDISNLQRDLNFTNAEIARYQQIRAQVITVTEIDQLIEDCQGRIESLRNNENMTRRSIFNMVERGASDSAIERERTRLDGYLDQIAELQFEISSLENLRREKLISER